MTHTQFPKETFSGAFKRQKSIFQEQVEAGSQFEPETGRYHLYLSYACPWAHRTLIVRAIKNLEDVISVSFVDPIRDEKGWRFSSEGSPYFDPVNGFNYLSEAYRIMDPNYNMRVTVPVLWDKYTKQIVNNESSDIIVMLNDVFNDFTNSNLDLYPTALKSEIDEVNDYIYTKINNGVYKCGFAADQSIYDREVTHLFGALDSINDRLKEKTYLVNDTLTLADIRLFVTLIRFDVVYYTHFKTSKKHIYEYEHLWRFTKNLYHMKKIKPTVKFDEIKNHYFKTHPHINPSGIVPAGPYIIPLLND
ncbi:MAG: glutathione S-transferase C-terminal domain-containing protein [Candidatus Marinimicrobia bacterium]|nr:glutathione S-transferase C-terminal domain-containing protein [Candidatus Neomarinimicrobiota bacterium]